MSMIDLDVGRDRTVLTESARAEKDARTLSLFQAAAGAEDAEGKRIRERIVLDHLGLAEAMARRVSRGGGDWADLRQVAYVGLVKAARRFTPNAVRALRRSPSPPSPANSSAICATWAG